MKKLFSLLIAFALLYCFFGCAMPESFGDEFPNTPEIEIQAEIPEEREPETENQNPVMPEADTYEPLLKPEIPTAETATEYNETIYIKALVSGLNIRKGSSTSGTPLGTMDKDDLLFYAGREGDWYLTYYQNSPAYVSAKPQYTILIHMEKGDEMTENVLEVGYKLMGFPYVYGAVRLHSGNGKLLGNFNPVNYDCSSLMQYIFYYGASYNLQLTTRTQVYQGAPVNKNDLARGDLIFFTNASRANKTGIERIGHVAIYLGNNYILHTASDYAVMEQISSVRWSYYIQANRFF